MKYIVEGGIWKDTSFTEIVAEKEVFGPFDTYKKALDIWRRNTYTVKLDNCLHRFIIREINDIT
jgi:hypothetical protein